MDKRLSCQAQMDIAPSSSLTCLNSELSTQLNSITANWPLSLNLTRILRPYRRLCIRQPCRLCAIPRRRLDQTGRARRRAVSRPTSPRRYRPCSCRILRIPCRQALQRAASTRFPPRQAARAKKISCSGARARVASWEGASRRARLLRVWDSVWKKQRRKTGNAKRTQAAKRRRRRGGWCLLTWATSEQSQARANTAACIIVHIKAAPPRT